MTDLEQWQAACERVGYEQHSCCRNDHPDHIHDWRGRCATRNYPPLGDPAAVVKMLEWLVKANDPTYLRAREKANAVRDLWMEIWNATRYHGETLPLALAAAVNALPTEKA